MAATSEYLLEVRGLRRHFPVGGTLFNRGRRIKAVDGVDLVIRPGETLGLVGESGCGKSTLGRLIARLDEPTDGTILFEGKPITGISERELRPVRRSIQIIFQNPFSSLNPRMRVRDTLEEPLIIHRMGDREARQRRVDDLLDMVGLRKEYADRYPHEFSGGQRQRIGIARALALNPKLIICDEPVSALDVSIQAQIVNLMEDLQKELKLSYLFISHDLRVVEHISDRVAVMYLGRIVESAPSRELYRNTFHPYTEALLSALPVPDPTAVSREIILEGSVPSPIDPPAGCHFTTRCPHVRDVCSASTPGLDEYRPEHWVRCTRGRRNSEFVGRRWSRRDGIEAAPIQTRSEMLEIKMDIVKSGHDPATLVIAYGGKIDQFTRSPLRPRGRASAMRWMFSSLLRWDEDGNLVGDLASRWEQSSDGCKLTFFLRPEATWHDGQPVTADDVVFTAALLKRPNAYFRNTLHLSTGEPAEFRALDRHTVEVTTPRPYAALPAYLTGTWASLFLIMPRHVVERIGDAGMDLTPVGCGPFRFGQITDDGHAVLNAHQSYFGGKPKLDHVVLRLFTNNEERIEAFRRGEIDVVTAPGRKFTREEAAKYSGRLEAVPSNQIVQFALNGRHPILKSVKVRQAIAAAMDRDRMVRDIEGPNGIPAYSPVGPTNWAHEPDVEKHPYDPVRAQRLLSEEGWKPGTDGILEKGGERLSFSVVFVPDTWNVDYAGYAEAMKRYLAGVGIELTVKPVEYWTGMKTAWRDHDFGAFMYYDTFYNEPDLYWSWHSSMPKRPEGPPTDVPAGLPQYGYGVTGYSSSKVDELVIAAREMPDRARRKAILSETQKIMAEEVASYWLFNYPYRTIVHDRLRGTSRPSLGEGTSDLILTLYPERLHKVV